MAKNILVTGANGYIGSHLVDYLTQDEDNQVHCMILKGTDEANLDDARQKPNFSIVYADLMDPSSLEKAFEGIDIIYHLAALVTDWAPKDLFMRLIVGGTKNVVEAAIKKGVKRIVYMSSLVVHGLGGHDHADESTPINPVPFFPYAIAKAEAEKYLGEINAAGTLETVIVRPGFDIVGPRNATSFFEMAKNIEKGRFGFLNDGKSLITLVNVKNLVAGMAHLGNYPAAAGEAYIVTDVSWTWRQYTEEICKRLGSKLPKLNTSYGLVAPFVKLSEKFARAFKSKKPPLLTLYRISVPRFNIDFRADKLLSTGFIPPYSFEQGLDEAIAWYKARKNADMAK
ncbi:MAG TPA: NAD-dependent epimerase/dehydratase family protein [Candidatus Lokiarchaeia archaeon]|nr:NAD-dependent epimerase/dehydratase family protein [Candidatus Lokiarchaeia archaeon]